jgi:hypothetical protein
MNAKLKELKLMALEKFASNHGLKLTHLGDLDPKSQEEVDSLFAELILRECISSIYGSDISDKKQERLVNGLAYKFGFLGVEE